jgi:hypothetical protein
MLRTRLVWICLSFVVLFLAAAAAQATYMETVMANNPIGYWRLGETSGTTVNNSGSAGSALNGTAGSTMLLGNLSPGALPSDVNRGSTCNANNVPGEGGGYTGYAEVPYNSAFDFGIEDGFTVEAWVKPSNPANGVMQAIAGHFNSGVDDAGYNISAIKNATYFIPDKAVPDVQIGDKAGNYLICYADVDLADGVWHHVAFTHAAGTTGSAGVKIYVDGTLRTNLVLSSGTLSDITTSVPLDLGARGPMNQPNANPLVGGLDEVAIYASELSGADIAGHYAHRNDICTPEPSTVVLLTTGLIGLLAYAWRKRR